eukprot:scaffold27070_cov147-Skeletonema_menzelii.AAC.1
MSQEKNSHAITGSSNQQVPSHLHGMQHQRPSDEANNSSLIYDRTMKVAKAEYTDHGSHGVAAVQMPNDTGMYGNMGGGGLQSSVQMQNQMHYQMQQMTALQNQTQQQNQMQQQQQQYKMPSNLQQPFQLNSSQLMQLMMLQQQNQMLQQTLQAQQNGQRQNQMMPPPNATAGPGHPGTTVGSQQLLHALANNPNAFVGSNGIGMGGGPGMSVASANVINTTSSGLIDALNSQLSAAQPPTNTVSESSLSQLMDANAALPNQIGMDVVAMNDTVNMFAPGEIVNGKKRVSPTVPLHPSQLVSGGGGYSSALSSSLGGKMNSVLEEEDELSTEPAQVVQDQAVEKGIMRAALEMGKSHSQKTEQNTGDIPVPAAPQDSKERKERGQVLTNPSKPAANGGLDNAEGNLIVHKGDIFRIPRKSMHSHPPTPIESSDKETSEGYDDDGIVEYEVMSLLGQGTFAQVFHCVETKSGQNVAVKIVKNKPAYTRQAAVEIDVFRKLSTIGIGSENDEGDASAMSSTVDSNAMSNSKDLSYSGSVSTADCTASSGGNRDAIIRLMYYFMHQSHLCLVFEMLGSNLYELLKKRQFRGLPLGVVKSLLRQAIDGIKLLGKKNVVHCDLKPENMLMVRNDAIDEMIAKNSSLNENGEAKNDKINEANDVEPGSAAVEEEQWIKLIDFGSACFEGQTTHTYIQSRFYRSPEVLVGLPYDSAIDMWSLGCVAAELFLGLPILPGVHEHDQVGRILEMIGNLPGWMLEQGSKSKKFFKSSTSRSSSNTPSDLDVSMREGTARTKWEFRTRQEYINYLSEEEKQSKGGARKLEQQPTSRYFKKKKLEDIVMHHGSGKTKKEKEELGLFVHFLKGLLDPDPWKRYTAFQASMHPFLSGSKSYRIKMDVAKDGTKSTPKPYDISWVQPWDPSIPRRKLMVVQKKGSRRSSIPTQQSVPEAAAAENPYLLPTRSLDIYGTPLRNTLQLEPQSPAMSVTSQMAAMADAMSLGRQPSSVGQNSPPSSLFNGMQGFPNSTSFGNSAGTGIPMSFNQLASSYQQLAGSYQNFAGRRLSENVVDSASQQQPQGHGGNESLFIPMPHVPPPPQTMGAQSFSGAYYSGAPSYHPNLESELGYALQRPGVVPGGNDILFNALQRQYSNSSVGSLNNLQSPARNYGNYGEIRSSGNNLLHTLGLQEQIAGMNSQYNGGGIGGAATSLLAQQLADYSDASQQGGMAAQAANLDAPQLQRQLSNSSMHGSYVGQGSSMSLGNSLPYFQSASFGDYGYGSAPQGQQIPAHHLNAIVNANLMAQAQVQATGQNHKNPNWSEQYEGSKKSSTTE